MVNARPILYSPAMVQARHAGRKTQTRRVAAFEFLPGQNPTFTRYEAVKEGFTVWHLYGGAGPATKPLRCPFGQSQDLLWCKEPWFAEARFNDLPPREIPVGSPIWYAADGEPPEPAGKPRLGRFMCRWMSRSTDRVTDIRVQRLKGISEDDAMAEGVVYETADPPFYYVPGVLPHSLTAVGVEELEPRHAERCYFKYWNHLNRDRGGQSRANPWVWAVSFEAIRANVDSVLEQAA